MERAHKAHRLTMTGKRSPTLMQQPKYGVQYGVAFSYKNEEQRIGPTTPVIVYGDMHNQSDDQSLKGKLMVYCSTAGNGKKMLDASSSSPVLVLIRVGRECV